MLDLVITGTPKPKGSVRAYTYKRRAEKGGGYGARVEHRASSWEKLVRDAVAGKWEQPPMRDAVAVDLRFLMPRPKAVSEKKRRLPWVRPDLDKLVRAVLDGLEGVVFADDSQVCRIVTTKTYVAPAFAGVRIRVMPGGGDDGEIRAEE